MKTSVLLYSLPLFLCSLQSVADECDAILEQGVRNTYQDITQQALKSNINTEFCSSSEISSGDSDEKHGGINFNIGKFGLGGSGGGSRDQYNKTKSELCTSSNSQLNDDGYHKVLTLIADPSIVNAWERCRSNRGLIINGEVRDSKLINVSVKFLNVHATSQAIVSRPPQIIGMSCPDFLKKDDIIDGNEQRFTCQRYGKDPITVNVNTNYMGSSLYIPAPKDVEYLKDSDIKKEPFSNEPVNKGLNCTIRQLPDGNFQMADKGCPEGPKVITGFQK